MKYIILGFLVSFSAAGATCKNLVDCVKEASALTGTKYIYPENMFTGKEELNVALLMDKDNADVVLSEALNLFDFMKAPSNIEGVVEIFPGRDIRYHASLPTFVASKTVTPVIQKSQDPIHLTYSALKGTDVGGIANSLRPFISRYGRVIDMASGTIIVVDRASVVSQVLPIIQNADVPGFKHLKPAPQASAPAKTAPAKTE